jgi:hypothetical protein
MEVSDVRRLVRAAIDDTRRRAEERRARKDQASRAWEQVLADVAIPLVHQVAAALGAEGHRFTVMTPGAVVRLVPERGGEEFVELALDTEGDEPSVMVRSTRGRGRRTVSSERALSVLSGVDALTDNDIAVVLIEELKPFLQR